MDCKVGSRVLGTRKPWKPGTHLDFRSWEPRTRVGSGFLVTEPETDTPIFINYTHSSVNSFKMIKLSLLFIDHMYS